MSDTDLPGPSRLHPGGFGIVPTWLLRHPDADPYDVALYAAIASCVEFNTGEGPARQRRLAERSCMGVRAVRVHEDRLVRLGVLELEERRGRAKVYRLLPTPYEHDGTVGDSAEDEDAMDPRLTGAEGGRRRNEKRKAPAPAREGPSEGRGLPEEGVKAAPDAPQVRRMMRADAPHDAGTKAPARPPQGPRKAPAPEGGTPQSEDPEGKIQKKDPELPRAREKSEPVEDPDVFDPVEHWATLLRRHGEARVLELNPDPHLLAAAKRRRAEEAS